MKRAFLKWIFALTVLTSMLSIGPARADGESVTATSFPEFNRASCAENRLLGKDPLGRFLQCSPPPPPISQGGASATDDVHDDGSFALHDSANGGSMADYWYAVSSVIYEAPWQIDRAAHRVDVTMTWRIDQIYAQGAGTGDLSAYGTATIYAQAPATSSGAAQVCQGGGSLQSLGQTDGMHFYDNLAPGIYQVHVGYTCSDGSAINPGELFGAELVAIGYVASRDANGWGHSDIVGQLQSVRWDLQD